MSTEITNSGQYAEVTVLLADGNRAFIGPGKSKTFLVRDGKFHLLDCMCERCAGPLKVQRR